MGGWFDIKPAALGSNVASQEMHKMNKQELQAKGAGLIRVTGQDKKGDVYFMASKNVHGVVRSTKRGYVVLAGHRRTDGYWVRNGCDYSYNRYPVYEVAVACIGASMATALKSAVTTAQQVG